MHPATLPEPPGKIKPHVWRDGRQYFSMPELARLRNVTPQAVRKWAKNHPDRCVHVAGHTYAELIK